MVEEKSADNISVKSERAYSALSEVLSQKFCSISVRELPHPYHELDHVTTALAVAETPEAIDRRRDDEAAIGRVRADRARTSQLSSALLQLDAEHGADLLDRNSLAQRLEVHTLVGAHWCTSLFEGDRPMLFYQ